MHASTSVEARETFPRPARLLVAAVGTAYVLVHEHRRRAKKERKAAAVAGGADGSSGVLSAERLVEILSESANAAYQLIEQTRKMVHEKHVQTGASLESCVDELQRDFEAAMETVMASIRAKHGVSEPVMSAAMVSHQADPVVAGAVTALREAMGGKPPPGYGEARDAGAAEAAKARRRGKQRRKG